MAQRLSEQVVEWLTVGGDSFTPHFKSNDTKTNVPLVVNKPGTATTFPTTGGTAIGIYNNQGQIWTLGAAAASTSQKSSQIIISSSDAGAGDAVGLELWRGTNASWQILNKSESDSINGILYIGNNYTTSAQSSYTTNLSMRYGAVANQYVRIHSTKDSDYEHTATGAALIVDGGATFAKKVYIEEDEDSNYTQMYGAFVVEGGASFGKKVFIADTTDATADTTGSLVTTGGLYVTKKIRVSDNITLTGTTANTAQINFSRQGYNYIKTPNSADAHVAFNLKGTTLAADSTLIIGQGAAFPGKTNTYALGTSSLRWKALYIGTADSYGSNTQPIYWDTGVPKALTYTANRWYYSASTTSFEASGYAAAGKITINGTSAPANSGNFQVIGTSTMQHIYPQTDSTYNIGSTSLHWTNGFFDGLTISTDTNFETSANNYNGTRIAGSGNIYVNTTSATTSRGYYVYGNAVQYGRWYVGTIGTAAVSDGAETPTYTNTTGSTYLELGNNKQGVSGNSASVANNARGVLRLYSPSTTYTDIRAQAGYSKNFYISPYNGDMYSVHTGGNTAVGSGTKPVYIAANGRVTASSSTVGTATKGVYLSSGTITAMTYELKATVNAATTANTLAYYSSTTGISSYPRMRNIGSARYPIDMTYYNDAGTKVAEHWFDQGSTTNFSAAQWWWRQWSPKATADTGATSYYEQYSLPAATTGRTSNVTYAILTTKNYAGPSQGTASRIAYYSAAATISSGTIVTDGSYLSKAGVGSSWVAGRDNALIRQTSCGSNSYCPAITIKTGAGSWEIGAYNVSSYANQLIFTYITDTNHSASTNSTSGQIRFGPGGYITTQNYGTGDPGSSTGGYGVSGALYFKRLS